MSVAVAEPMATSQCPLVTVVVPVLDEADHIADCLAAVVAQDYALDRLEVVVVDGGSTDGTPALAWNALDGRVPKFDIVDTTRGSRPANLNAGLEQATGSYLCRVDARSRIPVDYVRRAVEVLESRPDVAVVGGAQTAVSGRGRSGPGVARALNNPIGMGLARYRAGGRATATDTVYLGFFRVDDLRRVGGWDEDWETNQDFELNRRLGRTGLVWFDPALAVGYVPRSELRSLGSQYHRFGRWKVRYWRRSGDRPRPRQLILLLGAGVAVVGGLGAGRLALRDRRSAGMVAAALAGTAALFESASAGPRGGLRDRVVSVAASGVVAGGWISGVVRESLSSEGKAT